MNPWKITTIGIALVGVTAFSTGLTTAYFMRPDFADGAPASFAPAPRAAAAQAVAPAPQRPTYAVAPSSAPRGVRTAATTGSVTTVADCGSTGDRVWRIAKPGAVGGLIGAGVGAAGGAIADGGKAAGKGALIGGLAGAVLGAGYGAYKTKAECGSVLGGSFAPVYAGR